MENDGVIDFTEVRIKKLAKENPVRLLGSVDSRVKLTEELLRVKFELEQEMRKPSNTYKITMNTTPEEYKRMAKLMDWVY